MGKAGAERKQTLPLLLHQLVSSSAGAVTAADFVLQPDKLSGDKWQQLCAWPHEVERITITGAGELRIFVRSDAAVDGTVLLWIEQFLEEQLELKRCAIFPRFSDRVVRQEDFMCGLLPWAAEALVQQDFAIFSVLLPELECRSDWTDLSIRISPGQRKIFSRENIALLQSFYEERCGLECTIEIQNGKKEPKGCERFFDERETALLGMEQSAQGSLDDWQAPPIERRLNGHGEPEVTGQPRKKERDRGDKPDRSKGEKKEYRRPQPSNLIWGRMDQRLELMDLKMLDAESGRVSVYGAVSLYESRLVSNNTRSLVKFHLHGSNGAIACVMFLPKPEDEVALREQIPNGTYVRVDMDISYDAHFSKDLQGKVIGLCHADAPAPRQDIWPDKRVELHLHTNMSAKDGFTRPAELVHLADHFGMPAVAITDHGVVQSFPEAAKALDEVRAKGSQMKLIYGSEIYLMEDGNEVAYGFGDLAIDDNYVALDLETTGLDPAADRIIEIAAVRFRRDESGHYFPEERYSTFVNPGIPVPPKVTELTGITTEMLAEGRDTKTALAELHAFLGNDPICAHNAFFDLGFLRYEAYRITEYTEAKLKFNPVVIDSLQMARSFLPELRRYNLQEVANHLNIPLAKHHRAVDDSIACGFIFAKLWAKQGHIPLRELNQKAGQHSLERVKEFRNKPYHCIVLVKDLLGLYNLYRLVSESHVRYFKGKPRVPRSLLKYLRNGLIIGSACEAGEVFRGVTSLYKEAKGDYQTAKQLLAEDKLRQKTAYFYDYLEIQPTGNNSFMLEREDNYIESRADLENLNRLVLDLGDLTGKPVVATCDAHVLNEEDGIYRQILQVANGFDAQENQTNLFFRSTDEMLKEFTYLPEDIARRVVIDNTQKIASMVSPDIRPFPQGTFPPEIPAAADEVVRITWEACNALYAQDGEVPEPIVARVEKELSSIIDNGFGIMYYISHKLVKKTNEDGYIVGSRGSVGSSVVAFLCGISEVNPLPPHYVCRHCHRTELAPDGVYGSGFDLPAKVCPACGEPYIRDGQDIPFETFLGFDGDKQPDIDLNFSGEYQSSAHQYIVEMFGDSHTYRAGTITGYAEKNAAGLVLKYMEATGLFFTKAEIARLAQGLNGIKRSTGQHPGGIVVIPKDREVFDFTPIQFPADKEDASMNTTHFDFNAMHDTILKLDILGHDDPTMLKVMSDITGVKIEDIPIPDPKVMALFRSTEPLGLPAGSTPADCGSLGLPEMGTRMARDMIRETQPTQFFDLVQLMGLSHGTDVWNGNAQDLIRGGIATINEVIGCRDGIMTSLINWGLPAKESFDIMEKVRKGRGVSEKYEHLMIENKVPAWYIDSCKKIKYMFPKAHAAAYVISSLRVAWFKVYHPEAYYAAYFSVRADEFDYAVMCQPHAKITAMREELGSNFHSITDREQKVYYILELVEEMYLRGISFLPMDIEKSLARRFQVVDKGLILPALNTVPSISTAMAQAIVEARQESPFKSHEDLMRRAGIGQSAVKGMADLKILSHIPETAQLTLFDML